MYILRKTPRKLGLNEPIRHRDSHKRPVSRRDFIGAGFMTGSAVVTVPGIVGALLGGPRAARAALSMDLNQLAMSCGIAQAGAGKVPFIAFDLAGGASMVGSEVLIGKQGGQLDFLSTAGYAKLGLPGNMVPQNNFVDTQLGLAWHSDGAMLRGILDRTSAGTRALTNGAVIAARSENDTGNNPHNPMYGIAKIGADGSLLTLIGSRNSESGGNSDAPAALIDPQFRPTKVDRARDVTGLVDTGKLTDLFNGNGADAVAVLESIARISGGGAIDSFGGKLQAVNALPSDAARDEAIKTAVRCGYVKSADLADRFGNPAALNPDIDPEIVGGTGIFSQAEYDDEDEFRKTAAVMKMVINGYAGAGTITMGGYDYHGQGRSTGEVRNFRAGRCIGACLEYAARRNAPVMIYVFSDGSLSANNQIDNSTDGRGKFEWASDNQSTAASFFLVFNPGGRPVLRDGDGDLPAARHQQIGFFRSDGSVETASSPAANAVNLLVEVVLLNYLGLHGQEAMFPTLFPGHGLGNDTLRAGLTSFAPIVNGVIGG